MVADVVVVAVVEKNAMVKRGQSSQRRRLFLLRLVHTDCFHSLACRFRKLDVWLNFLPNAASHHLRALF